MTSSDNTYGEMVFRCGGGHVVVDGLGHAGVELLGAQTVAAAQDLGHFTLFHVGRTDVEIERIAQGTRFFGAIQDGDGLDRFRHDGEHVFRGEGAVEADFDQADFLAIVVQVFHDLFQGFAGRSHGDDNPVGLGVADIVEGLVAAAGQVADLLHVVGHDARCFEVIGIAGFPALEIDVRVLGRAPQFGPFGVGAPGPEGRHGLAVDQFGHVGVVDHFDFLDFMGGAEPVEKVQEGNTGLDGGKMGDERHVHGFLDRVGGQQPEAGLAHGHDILVIPENRQGVGGNGAGRDMKNRGQQFPGHLVHVGDHQQQALGGREGRGQRAPGQRTVHGGRGPGFGLHLADRHVLSENVLAAVGGPVIGNFSDG